jgi:hypothetical protein
MKKPDGSFWAAPSDIQDVESNLLNSVTEFLTQYKETPVLNYTDNFRKNSVLNEQLSKTLQSTLEALKDKMRYPQLCETLFEQMTNSIKAKLDVDGVQKLDEAVNELLGQKQNLPKVELKDANSNNSIGYPKG